MWHGVEHGDLNALSGRGRNGFVLPWQKSLDRRHIHNRLGEAKQLWARRQDRVRPGWRFGGHPAEDRRERCLLPGFGFMQRGVRRGCGHSAIEWKNRDNHHSRTI